MNEFMASITELLGVTNAGVYALVASTILSVVAITLSIAASRKAAEDSRNRKTREGALGGKIERLEHSLNDTRTELHRAVQLGLKEPLVVSPEKSVGALSESPADIVESALPAAEPSTLVQETLAPPPATLSARLSSTRRGLLERLKAVFVSKPKIDPEMLDEITATLLSSDLGPSLTNALVSEVKEELTKGEQITEEDFIGRLKAKLESMLRSDLPSYGISPVRRGEYPQVILVVGVNGVGKTTTIAKLAERFKAQGARSLLVAGDTFRAAAVAQLTQWAERIGVPIVAGPEGSKPGAVVFDGMKRAVEDKVDVVIVDTAGRLHSKTNLMQELEGVRNSIQKHIPDAPHETILVVDGTTGQNAIQQAKEFHQAVTLTGIIITKLDGTPKGGVVVAIRSELGIPVRYIGIGEGSSDLREFSPHDFTEALFDDTEDKVVEQSTKIGVHAEQRRKRRTDSTEPFNSIN